MARQAIATHAHDYICNALKDQTVYYAPASDAIDIIMERMEGLDPLSDWVWARVLQRDTECYPSYDDMHAFRLRWLDSLIEEFSS